MSAKGKQIRGGKGWRSGNSSGAVDGGDVGVEAVRRKKAWLNWLGMVHVASWRQLGLGFNY